MIAIATGLLLVWMVVRFAIPIGQRYRFYRLQERVANYSNPPNPAVLHFSATQPYARIPGPVDQFYDSFWTARPKTGLGRMTIGPSPGGPPTPVFCGTLKTPGGQTRIVQVYAAPGPVKASGITQTSGGSSISLIAASCELQAPRWVVSGSGHQWQEDIDVGSILFKLNPSEADVSITVNGSAELFKLHVVDLPPTQGQRRVGFALDFDRHWPPLLQHGWSSVGIWQQWPFTGKLGRD
jgi:hypothetical protein